jgi:hypothetical protein
LTAVPDDGGGSSHATAATVATPTTTAVVVHLMLERWLLGLGIAATLAANVAHGLGHGLIGATVAAWPGMALVPDADPPQAQAAQVFACDLAADCVPSVRAIRAWLHVGQSRAQRVRAYLATGA